MEEHENLTGEGHLWRKQERMRKEDKPITVQKPEWPHLSYVSVILKVEKKEYESWNQYAFRLKMLLFGYLKGNAPGRRCRRDGLAEQLSSLETGVQTITIEVLEALKPQIYPPEKKHFYQLLLAIKENNKKKMKRLFKIWPIIKMESLDEASDTLVMLCLLLKMDANIRTKVLENMTIGTLSTLELVSRAEEFQKAEESKPRSAGASAGNTIASSDQGENHQYLEIYYQNCQNILKNKRDAVKQILCTGFFDVIILTDTWLNKDVHDVEITNEDYPLCCRNDRKPTTGKKKSSGGIIALVNKKYHCKNIKSGLEMDTDSKLDFIAFDVILSEEVQVRFLIVYAPLITQNEIDHISLLMTELVKDNTKIVITGEFESPTFEPNLNSGKFRLGGAEANDRFLTTSLAQHGDFKKRRDKYVDFVFPPSQEEHQVREIFCSPIESEHKPLHITLKFTEK